MTHRKAGRPKGARQSTPTKGEIASYVRLLRSSAEAGDVQSAATLINLHAAELNRLSCSEQAESKRHGV